MCTKYNSFSLYSTLISNTTEHTNCLNPVCVLSHHPKGSLEVVVNLVNVLVDTFVMKKPVNEVVPSVLQNKTANQLGHCDVPTWKKERE